MTFDIAAMDTLTLAEQGQKMPVLHLRTRQPLLDDDGTPITITLLGGQSTAFREALHTIQARRALVTTPDPTAVTREKENIELLVACTQDWSFKVRDGQPFPCTPANVGQFWNDERFRPLRDAAIAFVLNDANFLAEPAPLSAPMPATSSSSPGRFQPVAAA